MGATGAPIHVDAIVERIDGDGEPLADIARRPVVVLTTLVSPSQGSLSQ